MRKRIESSQQLFAYLHRLKEQRFCGILHWVVEDGNIVWIYEKAEEPKSDPVLIAVSVPPDDR